MEAQVLLHGDRPRGTHKRCRVRPAGCLGSRGHDAAAPSDVRAGAEVEWRQVRLGRNLAFGPAKVAGSSPTNVWLFGIWLLRWDGRHWHKVPAPTGIGAGELSPVVLGPASVWMYGLRFDKSLGKNDCVSTIWHWNGRRWRSWSKPRFCATGLAATSAKSVWLVGDRGPGARSTITAWRWNGRSWVAPMMPHPPSYNAHFVLPDITAGSAGNVWIGDDTANTVFPQAQGPGFALRWTGRRWVRTPPSPLASPPTGTVSGWARMPNGPAMAGWIRLLGHCLTRVSPIR